jgi:hypothetical protein
MPSLIKYLIIVALLPGACFGSLVWENQSVDLRAKPHELQMTGVFRFRNTGTFPVTITTLQPSCGCTTAELTKRTYLPTETGEIRAVYKLNGVTGEQRKYITVTTDDPTAETVQLNLHINVPELLTCTPRMLLWRMGGTVDEKSAIISAPADLKITGIEIKTIVPEKEAVVRIEHDSHRGTFQLFVHPLSSLSVSQTVISCIANFADGTTRPFSVFALVR